MVIIVALGVFSVGAMGSLWVEFIVKREERLESLETDSLQPHEAPPRLPAPDTRSVGSPYRMPSLVPAETAEEDNVPKSISFERVRRILALRRFAGQPRAIQRIQEAGRKN